VTEQPIHEYTNFTDSEYKKRITPDINQRYRSLTKANTEVDRDMLPPLILKIGDYALVVANLNNEYTAFDLHGGHQDINPFVQGPPYVMDGANFVYWVYKLNGIHLKGGERTHSTKTIRTDSKLMNVGNVGSFVPPEELRYGDIVYFGLEDWHIGIYVGNGDFVSFNGQGSTNFARGAEKKSLIDGYWSTQFKGHVQRLKDEEVVQYQSAH